MRTDDRGRDLHVTCMPWDHLTMLRTGEVRPQGWNLWLECRDRVWDWREDPSYDAGELSFSRHLQALQQGDDSIVALPLFLMRSFRQRCIMVPKASSLRNLPDLAGKRIGVPGWADTGNTWTRALLREAGVGLDDVEWTVGLAFRGVAQTIHRDSVAVGVRFLESSQNIFEELLDGHLDCIFYPFLPWDFHRPDYPLRHLFDDFVAEEQGYYRRVGYSPGLHLLGVRRTLLDRRPWLAQELLDLFGRARRTWIEHRSYYADSTPWLQHDVERSMSVFGGDWFVDGVEANRAMTADFCTELFEQHVVADRIDPDRVFAGFEEFAQREVRWGA